MRYKINLLPPPQQSFIDKAIFFSYNYLRYILVITQMVVLGVFTYRFTVDQDIVDLKDRLRQKQEIVKVSKPLLAEGAVIDDKIRNIKSIISKQQETLDMISYYLSIYPEKISATHLTIQQNEVSLEGRTSDINVLQSFYKRLKDDNKFKSSELKNVEKTDTGYSFSMSLRMFQI
jgi:Tfp pilus assembly protein PilN